MTSSVIPWRISAVWISLTLLLFLVIDPWSARSWMLVATVAAVPSLILFRLWSDGPPPTVAEVLYTAERRR